MKKVISFVMVFMLMSVLFTQVAAAELAVAQSKISAELMSEFSSLRKGETTLAYVEMQDVDHDAVMKEFARRYPEEYAAYVAAKTGSASPLGTASTNEALLQRALELKRAVYRDFYLAENQAVISNYVQTRGQLFVSAYSPVTILELDRSTALSLARSDAVISVSECPDYAVSNEAGSRDSEDTVLTEANMPTILASINRSNQISRADYLRDTKNLTGSGVKIGIIEDGVPDPANPYLQNASITIRPGDTTTSEHTTLVAMILAAVGEDGTKYGVVPNAQLYCAELYASINTFENVSAAFYSDIEWMLSSGVNVINASMFIYEDHGDRGTYDYISKWVDHIATVHDVHFVTSAGNNDYQTSITDELTGSNEALPYTIYVSAPAMAYNAIAVGGFWANGSDAVENFTMTDLSGKDLYSYMEKAGTRPEKPNLVANAYMGFYRENGVLKYLHGTSFSAPQVTGVIAQLCCWDGNLKFRQNVVGAVLAASAAEKVDSVGNGYQGDIFGTNAIPGSAQISNKEGVGILDARWAWGILANHNYWNIIQNGVGKNGTNVFYEKTVTINTNVNNLTRIAIYWTKNNTNINHSNNSMGNNPELTNFNLYVYDSQGELIACSETAYSNFEIVQFEPVPPGTYRIVIEIEEASNRTEYVGLAIW